MYRDRNKSRQPTSSSGNPDDAFASDLDSQGTADSDLPTDPDSVSMGPFSYSFPEVPTISSTFEAGAEAVIDDPRAATHGGSFEVWRRTHQASVSLD